LDKIFIADNFLNCNFDEKYQIVRMFHVVEHVVDPIKTIKKVGDILAPQGMLVIRTPNMPCFQYFLFGKAWYSLEVPRHLNLFSGKEIRPILESNNFDVEKIKYSSSAPLFVRSFMRKYNKKHNYFQKKYPKGVTLGLNILYNVVDFLRLSDTITVTAYKK
jgi:2-polyprenyl-3-methyl-5-hydroxy-6-metoxy-1,4-benzoquinol methylase